jgi:hypothetical protein
MEDQKFRKIQRILLGTVYVDKILTLVIFLMIQNTLSNNTICKIIMVFYNILLIIQNTLATVDRKKILTNSRIYKRV